LRRDLLEAWRETILPEDGDRMVTLGFKQMMRRDVAVGCLEHFLAKMNRYVFGKRCYHLGLHFHGTVILERKRLSWAARGSPHFHCLLRESENARPVGTDRLRCAVEKSALSLRFPTLNRYEPFGEYLSGTKYVDVTSVDNPIRLSDYLTKEFRHQKIDTLGITVGFIGADGVTGLKGIGEPDMKIW